MQQEYKGEMINWKEYIAALGKLIEAYKEKRITDLELDIRNSQLHERMVYDADEER